MNNKGFMMAEVVVVSSIILVALVAFYASYNKIISLYNQRVDYYDVTTLYKLAEYRDNTLTEGTSTSSTAKKDSDGEKIYYVNKSMIKNKNLTVNNQTFKDYLEYLSTSLDFDSLPDKILIMEKCNPDDSKNNCKYAYLEVFSNA